MKYRALIFDFDYTLGDTTASIAASINYALACLGYPPSSEAAIRRTIGYSLQEAFRMLTGDKDEEKEEKFFDYFQIKADEVMTADARLFPNAEHILREWGAKIPIGIVSTKHRFRITDILKKFSLLSCVPVVVGNEDVSFEKPHPEGVWKAASLLGCPREEALYVGDSVVDAEASQRAGVDFCAVLTGTCTREMFSAFPSVCIADDLFEFEKFLNQQ